MRIFSCLALLAAIVTACHSGETFKVRFDGYYQSVDESFRIGKDTARMFLRFFPNGQVISVTSTGTAFQITSWFNSRNKNVSTGNYNVSTNWLDFTSTSKSGSVIYKGKIVDENHLDLNVKSLINGHESNEKYSFIKVPDLK